MGTDTNGWHTLTAGRGRIVTNSYDDSPDGSWFVAVEADGGRRGWWAPETFASDHEAVRRFLDELCTTTGSERVWDDEFGVEDSIGVLGGSIRVDVDRESIRVADAGGCTVDDAAYWVVEEIAEDPSLVVGAVLGAASGLRTR